MGGPKLEGRQCLLVVPLRPSKVRVAVDQGEDDIDAVAGGLGEDEVEALQRRLVEHANLRATPLWQMGSRMQPASAALELRHQRAQGMSWQISWSS